jgi:hypothetical protein
MACVVILRHFSTLHSINLKDGHSLVFAYPFDRNMTFGVGFRPNRWGIENKKRPKPEKAGVTKGIGPPVGYDSDA